jgi:hypothetical protein
MALLSSRARDLLAAQNGVVTRWQLTRLLGHSEDEVDGLVQRGRLEIIYRGTYRASGSARSAEQTATAAALRCRSGARVTGPFILGLLNVEGFTRADPFEVIVSDRRSVSNVPFTVRRAPLPRADFARVCDVPAVTPSRCLVDAARHVSGKRLRVGIDSARWLGLTDEQKVRECALRLMPGDPGAQAILRLLDAGRFRQESEGERALADVLADFEPQPEWGVWVTPRRRVDALWRDVLLILEYLGERHHLHPDDREKDAARDRELRALGFEILYLTHKDLADPPTLRARLEIARANQASRLLLVRRQP